MVNIKINNNRYRDNRYNYIYDNLDKNGNCNDPSSIPKKDASGINYLDSQITRIICVLLNIHY